jgi:hypothetical protein
MPSTIRSILSTCAAIDCSDPRSQGQHAGDGAVQR